MSSRPILFDSRSMTDYRQSCVRENSIQTRIKNQIDPNHSKIILPCYSVSVETSKFLQDNSAVIRDTDRNLVYNKRKFV
jgi:hypothetical protein